MLNVNRSGNNEICYELIKDVINFKIAGSISGNFSVFLYFYKQEISFLKIAR